MAAGTAVFALVQPSAYAASGTWTQSTSGGLWSDTANWNGGTIADGSGSTANFNTLDLTADNTVHMDASHTLTGLTFGDTTTTSVGSWIVDNYGGANVLTFAGTTPTITVNALGTGSTATISAGISYSSSGLTKAGPGKLILAGAVTQTGTGIITTIVRDGTLDFNNQNVTLGNISGGTVLTLGGGSAGSAATIATGTGILTVNSTMSYEATNNPLGATITGKLRLGSANGSVTNILITVNDSTAAPVDLTISADISESVTGNGLTKGTAGSSLLLSGQNSYTGQTIVNAGTLIITSIKNVGGGSSALGAPTTTANGTIGLGNNANTGTLTYTGGAQDTDRIINLRGTTGGATLDQSGTGLLRFTNASVTATGAGIKTFTLQGSTAGTGEIDGAIPDNSSTNKTSLNKAGTGIWALAGTNTYSGGTTVANGVLTLLKTAAVPASGTVTVQAGGTLGLGVGGTGYFSSANVDSLFAGTLTLGSGAVSMNASSGVGIDTSAGDFTYTISLSTRSLTKLGTNTLTLTGTHTYSGATVVSGGTLLVNGSISGSLTVASGAKFGGTGTVGGSATINPGAILAPGNAGVGKENFSGNLTIGSTAGSIFEWELAATPKETPAGVGGGGVRGTDYDAVNVAGTLGGSGGIFRVVLNGSQNFSESFWDSTRTWTDIFKTADGGSVVNLASFFSSVEYWNSTTGNIGTPTGQGSFSISGSSLTWTAVPEPTTALAGLLLGSGLLRRSRKR